MEQLFAAAFLIGTFGWIIGIAWYAAKTPTRPDATWEKGHGIVPSAMQNDMMDRG